MKQTLTSPDGTPASRFAFGTMQFGGGADADASRAMFDACVAAGINHFDTAHVYTGGASETLLGGFIQDRRDSLIIATKAAYSGGAGRENILKSTETSRQRMKIDTLDVLYLHRFDPDTPLEESFAAFADLKKHGHIRHIGLSNFAAWQVVNAAHIAARFDLPVAVIQPMYNLVKRQAEVEILPMADAMNILVAPYSPLGGGLLTGKYGDGGTGRLTENDSYAVRYGVDAMHHTAHALVRLAVEEAVHPATLAVAWAAAHPTAPSPIISARSLAQLQPSLDATEFAMTPELYARIAELSPTPPPATDRLEEAIMSDIVIIGGGIAGLSAAARLSADARVTVLEQEDATGYHASGRSAALFEEEYGLPSTIALNTASKDYHFEANGGYLSPRGLMILGRSDEQTEFEADAQKMGVDVISCAEAIKMVPVLDPNAVEFAGYHEAAFDIDTDRMMQDFIRVIRKNRGEVRAKSAVKTIARTARGWTVYTKSDQYTCTTLVNAAGAWADTIARMAGVSPLGIVPHRRSMARIPAPGGADPSKWPMFFGVGETWYAKPDAGALLVSPADEDPVEPHDAFADDMVLAEGIARYEGMVTKPVTRLLASWAGLRSFAPDRALVLGPDPLEPDFIWCAGQGGYGFQTAPAASQLLADLVMGREPALPPSVVAALTPHRFRA